MTGKKISIPNKFLKEESREKIFGKHHKIILYDILKISSSEKFLKNFMLVHLLSYFVGFGIIFIKIDQAFSLTAMHF